MRWGSSQLCLDGKRHRYSCDKLREGKLYSGDALRKKGEVIQINAFPLKSQASWGGV